MKLPRPTYEATDAHGIAFLRPASRVHELSTTEQRFAALVSATKAIEGRTGLKAKRTVTFATPVHLAFGLTRQQARNHAMAALLLSAGEDLPLDLCPEYV